MGKGTVGKGGRVGTIGLHGAPPEHERVGTENELTSSQAHEPVSSDPPPEVTRPVQYTLRLSYDESDELDTLARQLRKDAGRSVASAEVLRGLISEAAADDDLLHRLRARLVSS